MLDDQRTLTGSGSDSGSAPTQLSGSARTDERPTPRTIPAKDLDAWAAPPPRPAASPFHSTSEHASRPSSQASGDETMLMRTEPEPLIPLAWLAIVEGPGGKRGTVFTLKPETIVGRTSGDFLLSGDVTVSSQHVRLRLEPKEGGQEGEQVFVAYDQASSNGTFVGSRQTYREEDSRVYRHELKDGDYMLVGETTLVFKQAD